MHLPPEIVEKVQQAANIVEIISETVSLRQEGANFRGLCPFHNEKTPSFTVSPDKKIFKCFGCNKAGNVFHFLMESKGISFPQAVWEIAQRYGISVPMPDDEDTRRQKTLIEVMEWATQFFQKQLRANSNAWQYVISRGISPEFAEKFRIGYASSGWSDLYQAAINANYNIQDLMDMGLITKGNKNKREYYDRFHNRIIFPIFNVDGNVIAFGGRTLQNDEEPKYLNSPETSLFHKKKILYGMNFAKKACQERDRVMIVEGYVDLIITHQYGFTNTIATMGTSLSLEHIKTLQHHTQNVILVYDGDAAGEKASQKSLAPLLKQGMIARVVILPQKVDPSDYLVQQGAEAFSKLLDTSQEFWDFQISSIAKKYDTTQISGKRYILQEILKMVREISDKITQNLVLNKVSEIFQISTETLQKNLPSNDKKKDISPPTYTHRKTYVAQDEKFIVWVLLHYPSFRASILEKYPTEDFKSEIIQKLVQEITFDFNQGSPIDVSTISTRLDAIYASELIDIYWSNFLHATETVEGNNFQIIRHKLELVFKGLQIDKSRKRLASLLQMYNQVHPDDITLQQQIIRDFHTERKHFQEITSSQPN